MSRRESWDDEDDDAGDEDDDDEACQRPAGTRGSIRQIGPSSGTVTMICVPAPVRERTLTAAVQRRRSRMPASPNLSAVAIVSGRWRSAFACVALCDSR